MLEYTFSIIHKGCWTADLNDAFPGVRATIIYSYRLTGTSITMVEVTRIDEDRLDDLVDWLEDHPVMNTSQLVTYDEGRGKAFISLSGDYDTNTVPVLNVLLRNDCFPTIPATVARGREHWSVLASSHEQVSKAHEELRQIGSVDVDSLRSPNLDQLLTDLTGVKEAVQNLSPRQHEVLSRAIDEGYYDSPRSCNIEELAELDSANTSTVGEHLRRSEAKILKAVEPMLERPAKASPQKN
ncbi:helix-turn-helix domain-containing protein [Halobellus sp. GM3]|uniref:helix-turn-helix domain-containing protein n=1 Tax=Halobellus sp. GM3 TaxID=3458410 RepID=UPI00403E1AF8